MRACGVVAKGFDMHGEPVTIEGTELLARCVQHETDHLDGILFIDRLDRDQRKLALKAIREAEWAGETAPTVKVSPHADAAATRSSAGRLPPMRLVFAGTPEVAVPALDALLGIPPRGASPCSPGPTRRAGRGRHAGAVARSPRAAAEAGIEMLQAGAGRATRTLLDRLRRAGAGLLPGRRVRRARAAPLLDVPRHGWVNLHFSLLPAWRGAAPVQHAVLHGDEVTGATTFRSRRAWTPVRCFGVLTEPIRPRDTSGDLLGRLAVAGAGLLVATLDGLERGELVAAAAARRRGQPGAQDHRRGRPGRLGGAGAPRRPAGPRLHAGAGRVDHVPRRPARPRPGRSGHP